MKKAILSFIILCTILVSCERDSTKNVSKVTNYPIITINGEALIILNQGDSFTDLGAVAIEGTEEINVTTKGTVDTNIPNVYKIVYEAVNVDGFPASKTRTVVVLSTEPSTINLEGTFYRNETNSNNVTRLADRKYICDNATGYINGNENNLTLVFYNIDDEKIYAPYQENASETGISAESNVGTIVDENNWSWVIYASSFFGTLERIFSR